MAADPNLQPANPRYQTSPSSPSSSALFLSTVHYASTHPRPRLRNPAWGGHLPSVAHHDSSHHQQARCDWARPRNSKQQSMTMLRLGRLPTCDENALPTTLLYDAPGRPPASVTSCPLSGPCFMPLRRPKGWPMCQKSLRTSQTRRRFSLAAQHRPLPPPASSPITMAHSSNHPRDTPASSLARRIPPWHDCCPLPCHTLDQTSFVSHA